ncbi:MAG: hypothetical protein V9E94_09675 [Microthrixaceae bacterium]
MIARSTRERRSLHDADAHPTGAEHQNLIAGPDVHRVDRRTDAGLDSTTDHARNVEGYVRVDAYRSLFGDDDFFCPPGEPETTKDRLTGTAEPRRAVGEHRRGDRHGVGADAEQPPGAVIAAAARGVGCEHDMITDRQGADTRTGFDYDSGGLVTRDGLTHRRVDAAHDAHVGVTHPAGDDTDPHLARARPLELDVVDDTERGSDLGEQRCTHQHPLTPPGRTEMDTVMPQATRRRWFNPGVPGRPPFGARRPPAATRA